MAQDQNDIDDELGVEKQYADEIRSRMEEEQTSRFFESVWEAISAGHVPERSAQNSESRQWIMLLVAAIVEGVRETRRIAAARSAGEAVRQSAVYRYQDRVTERALDGSLFHPLDENHPETFKEILTVRLPEWAVESATEELNVLRDQNS